MLAHQLRKQAAAKEILKIRTGNGDMVIETGRINETFRKFYQKLYEAGPGGEEGDMRRFLDELEFPQVEEDKRQANGGTLGT